MNSFQFALDLNGKALLLKGIYSYFKEYGSVEFGSLDSDTPKNWPALRGHNSRLQQRPGLGHWDGTLRGLTAGGNARNLGFDARLIVVVVVVADVDEA